MQIPIANFVASCYSMFSRDPADLREPLKATLINRNANEKL